MVKTYWTKKQNIQLLNDCKTYNIPLTVEEEIKRQGTSILTNVEVFDVYAGDKIEKGKKQIAYSLTFNSKDKTLKEEEVDNIFRNIIEKVKDKFMCEIRDK